jgi:prepilin-type N-terminal cleavage/methylation domain-containing protein
MVTSTLATVRHPASGAAPGLRMLVRTQRPRFIASGFTLVELLVAIGIVAALLGIILPAVGRVRSAANATLCMSGTRQLTQAFLSFASDHKGRLPGNWWDAADPDPTRRSWLVNQYQPWDQAPQGGTVYRYLKNDSVYRCPSQEFVAVNAGTGSNGRFDFSSFPAFAGARLSQVPLTAEYRSAAVRETVFTPIVIEEDPAFHINNQFLDAAHCNGDRLSPVHRGGGHYGAPDGSVQWHESISALEWYGQTPSGRWVRIGYEGQEPSGWWGAN